MNSISSYSSASSSRRKWVYKFIFIPFILFLLIFSSIVPALAYDAYCNFYYNGTVSNHQVNENEMFRFTGTFDGLEFGIDNTDPPIFEVGRHYTFDVVFGIWFGNVAVQDDLYAAAVNSLVTNGYTEEWFTHYVYGFDIGYFDGNDNYFNFSPENYYAPQSETVVHYAGQYYSDLTDVLPSLSGTVNGTYQDRLYLQVKVHMDFDCTAPLEGISIMWSPYQFKPEESGGAAIFHSAFDISNLISYDYTAIQGMNMIAHDIKAQISGMESSLTSSLQQLLDMQDRYWNILIGEYEFSDLDNGMGVVYNILDFQYQSLNQLTVINSNLRKINTNVTTISTNSTYIRNLLMGATTTFWDFLEANFDVLHEDLVDIKNYLDQTDKSSDINSTVNDSIGSMMQVANPGDLSLNNVSVPELANEGSWNWFSQTVDLIDFTLPFLTLALAFGVFKAVFS